MGHGTDFGWQSATHSDVPFEKVNGRNQYKLIVSVSPSQMHPTNRVDNTKEPNISTYVSPGKPIDPSMQCLLQISHEESFRLEEVFRGYPILVQSLSSNKAGNQHLLKLRYVNFVMPEGNEPDK